VTPAAAREEAFVVSDADAGRRLDLFLGERMPNLSRSRIQQLIRGGRVTAGARALKPGTPIKSGSSIRVEIPAVEAARPEAEALPLTVLYDDADVAVVDKPAGMVVHPAAGHRNGTLVNALLHHLTGLSGVGGEARPGIVHRLDRGTSGVMVIAKHDTAHRELARQFHDREVKKEYIALVWGAVRAGQTFDRPIGRHPRQRQKMSTRATRGRAATTTIVEAEPLGGVTLVRLTIGTGRTHQIRVHLSETGHAIVGDDVYGGERRLAQGLGALADLNRPFLHAARLTFAHPSDGRVMTFEAPMPEDLSTMLEAVRSSGAARHGGRAS